MEAYDVTKMMTFFGRIAGQLCAGMKREFLSPSKVQLTLSWGFPYEAFGPNGVVKPWHIMNLVESGRALSFSRLPNSTEEPFLCGSDLHTSFGIFMGSVRLLISKDMYDTSLPKIPLLLEKELVYVGKSSFNIRTDVVLSTRSLTLASCQVQSVLVNRETRRPAPLPDWWREKFGHYTSPKEKLKLTLQEEPTHVLFNKNAYESHRPEDSGVDNDMGSLGLPIRDGVSSLDLTICDSDSDFYGHANWSVYLKYCLEALVMGCPEKTSNILKRRALKSADLSYISEGLVGQVIKVKFWKAVKLPGGVHFNIEDCKSGQRLFSAFLEFYPLTHVDVLPLRSRL